ncbi:hypothetical protein GRI97_17790 [Altererythrobacter xixiisoli]|uniref:Uncharacterized protein n=1 Tax=Croceibacterium xixiisoli TaxID=1476466 RepID=A0A6I4U2J0_9SPHN|nr:hypothetical protein [Croceibacterium xixiisoli]MXP00844.1 hypothetical protein [Croceibacterium xixiisoli]
MYDYLDQSPTCLSSGSCFLLSAKRGWIMAAAQRHCPSLALAGWFSRMNLLEAVNDFSAVMQRFHRSGRQQMLVRDLTYPRITEFEAVMIAIWADVARQRSHQAGAVLELLLTEQQVPCTLAAMQRMAMAMRAIGLPPVGLEVACGQDAAGNNPG